MGNTKISIINLLLPEFMLDKIIASGYESKRQIIVLIKDKSNAIKSDLKCTGSEIDKIFDIVNFPLLSVSPK